MLNIQSILKGFEPISLAEMDSVALMERTDLKFTLKIEDISELLKLLNKTYKCLEINNCRLSSYQTEYLDDHKNILFTNHQNGKLNRFKIRFRDYIQSKITFLEIKFKSNKGVTKKNRIQIPFKSRMDYAQCSQFIEDQTPYEYSLLEIQLKNNFDRITLVNLSTKERVTIDLNLKFNNQKENIEIPELGIIEVKREKGNRKSVILSLLKENRIRPTNFSKYTIGSTLLKPELKYNKFKEKLLFINKINKHGDIWNRAI